jgi:hypothetical protein
MATGDGKSERRREALGWLVGRLAWEKGLRFETPAEPPAAKVPAQRTPKRRRTTTAA